MRRLLPFFLIALALPTTAYVLDTLTVTLLDVGHGDSILVRGPNGRAMLVDAGRKGAAPTVSNVLAAEGITRLDHVVGTHEDADHIGGMVIVLSYMAIGEYLNNGVQDPDPSDTTLFLRTYLASRSITPRAVTAGDTIALDPANVTVTVLNPQPDRGADDNEASVVLRLVYGTQSFLLAADAEDRAEQRMIATGLPLASTVLKVGHHGGKSATTASFVAAVDPAVAVISVGPNSYGHPSSDVVARLESSGATVYRTDTGGTVRVTATRTGLEVSTGTGTVQPVTTVPTTLPVPALPMMPLPTSTTRYVTVPVGPPMVVVTTAPAIEITPAAVSTPGSTGVRFGSRRYVVGNVPKSPPSGVSVGTRDVATGVRWKATVGTGVATGVKPPSGRFVRWSPVTRWQSQRGR